MWESQSSKPLWKKEYQEPLLSIDWSVNNLIGFSHGSTLELLVWKYPKTQKIKGEQQV